MINGLNKHYYKTAHCKKSVYASTVNHELTLSVCIKYDLLGLYLGLKQQNWNIIFVWWTKGRPKGVIDAWGSESVEAEEPIEARLFWAVARNHPKILTQISDSSLAFPSKEILSYQTNTSTLLCTMASMLPELEDLIEHSIIIRLRPCSKSWSTSSLKRKGRTWVGIVCLWS